MQRTVLRVVVVALCVTGGIIFVQYGAGRPAAGTDQAAQQIPITPMGHTPQLAADERTSQAAEEMVKSIREGARRLLQMRSDERARRALDLLDSCQTLGELPGVTVTPASVAGVPSSAILLHAVNSRQAAMLNHMQHVASYNPQFRTIFLLTDIIEPAGELCGAAVLVHELSHALDDQDGLLVMVSPSMRALSEYRAMRMAWDTLQALSQGRFAAALTQLDERMQRLDPVKQPTVPPDFVREMERVFPAEWTTIGSPDHRWPMYGLYIPHRGALQRRGQREYQVLNELCGQSLLYRMSIPGLTGPESQQAAIAASAWAEAVQHWQAGRKAEAADRFVLVTTVDTQFMSEERVACERVIRRLRACSNPHDVSADLRQAYEETARLYYEAEPFNPASVWTYVMALDFVGRRDEASRIFAECRQSMPKLERYWKTLEERRKLNDR